MQGKQVFLIPLVFIAVLIPVMIAALLLFRPDESDADCDCAGLPQYSAHSHGMALARENIDSVQLLFNVVDAAEVYDVQDGRLQPVAKPDPNMKHVTVDVLDAEIALGERLPVSVQLIVRDAETGEVVIEEEDAPAMYAPGHGYHFGDNYPLDPGKQYTFHVTISPVQALRVEGTHDRWLEPIEWEGSFSLDEEGNVEGAAMRMEQVGEFSRQGIHVILNAHHAETLYEVVDGEARPVEAMDHDEMGTTRYFAVDVTDHVVNYEEKLVGADVTLTFTQGDTSFDVTLPPVISPVMGFHYGANVELAPGEWTITATVGGLDFQRHAGAAVSLPLGAVSGQFTYTVEEAEM